MCVICGKVNVKILDFLEASHLLTRDPVLNANKQDKNVFNFHS